jgi:hypothetical protein
VKSFYGAPWLLSGGSGSMLGRQLTPEYSPHPSQLLHGVHGRAEGRAGALTARPTTPRFPENEEELDCSCVPKERGHHKEQT